MTLQRQVTLSVLTEQSLIVNLFDSYTVIVQTENWSVITRPEMLFRTDVVSKLNENTGSWCSTLLPMCFRNHTRYSPSTSFPFLHNFVTFVCLSRHQNDLSPLECSLGTHGPAPCKTSLVEKAHPKQLETMQLLPQQSEVDENSLKKIPICQVPSLEGANKAV